MMSHDLPPNDLFALWRQLWQHTIPSSAQPFSPPLTAQEVERKLAELRVIESWLTMSLGVLSLQINTLQLQKTTLDALTPKEGPKA